MVGSESQGMKQANGIILGLSMVGGAAVRAWAGSLPPAPAGVQVSHEYGIEFVTVGDAGNAGYPRSTVNWTGFGNDRIGRGSVSYEYRIARTEVTSGQWIEFLNTFSPRPMPESVRALVTPFNEFYDGPTWFGGTRIEFDPLARTARYELRQSTPEAFRFPVWGVSWRMAALYSNWLHNAKTTEWESLLSGAYDTATWGQDPTTGSFTDSLTHQAGARFWIPTLDEWGKAAFYDSNRFGQSQGGWWDRPYGSNEIPVTGYPNDPGAQTSTGIPLTPFFGTAVSEIPLWAYSFMSPWGLFDTAGATEEVVSEYPNPNNAAHDSVLTLGSFAGSPADDSGAAESYRRVATQVFAGGQTAFLGGYPASGLRIAAAIPAPASIGVFLVAALTTCKTNRRKS